MNFSRTEAIALLFAIVSLTGTDISSAQENSHIRFKFSQETGIPDETMLPVFVSNVTASREEPLHDGHHHGIMRLQRELNLDTYERADEIFNLLDGVRASIAADKQQFMREEICPLDKPRPAGPIVLEKLDAFDDNNDALGAIYLDEIEAQLSDSEFSNFLAWMGRQKAGTTILRFDHKVANKGRDPDTVRQEVCGRFESNILSSGRSEQ